MSDASERRLGADVRRVASLDIGSNTVLMLVAERGGPDDPWVRVDDFAEITRVSEGLDRAGVLADEPIARTAAALRGMAQTAATHGVDAIVATGTAPFRRASNGAAAAAALSAALGATVDVVSGEREAALALIATLDAFPHEESVLVADIGGASTELILARRGEAPRLVSLDVGSVRLAERCVESDPIADADVARIDAAIAAQLGRDDVRDILAARGAAPLIGIAGTVTTAAAVSIGLAEWDESRIHGMALGVAELADVFERVRSLPVYRRREVAGLEPKRADVFPAGARLLWAIAKAAGVDELRVSDRGIRWGRLAAVSSPVT
ncbi:MAG: Ppx/GppA family phosphatase [Myxococcales bacterium]|nr:Ppx/GppA family phosphatase [Myxococcales bacterium]